jgi:fibro-slime domain-containing protein
MGYSSRMRRWVLLGLLSSGLLCKTAGAEPVSSITQYGVTWTFDREYESGRFVTGDYWVVGPVTVTSVTPEPTGTRNGSAVNPLGRRQGYDDRGGEFSDEDQVMFPRELRADESLVSSISRPEGEDVKNVGALVSQAVLTVVAEAQPAGAFRPSYAGTYKRYLHESDVAWELLPSLTSPDGVPDGAELLAEAERPRIDHLSSWTIQNSCAEENWNNGAGAHACYGQQVSEFMSSAALFVLLDTPEREELARSLLQHGIDNYGVLRAGGDWAPNGGHHSGRKWPIVFAASLFDDCDMKNVALDYDASHFGEDGQTYVGANGTALFGWDCGGGHGEYFESGCTGSGAKDCRDPAGLLDGCEDYRNCCTSRAWVGQMLSAHLLGARGVWKHDAYFDYVDRWMNGDVGGADGSSAFVEAMWALHRDSEPARVVAPACGEDGAAGEGGAPSSNAGSANGGEGDAAGQASVGGDSGSSNAGRSGSAGASGGQSSAGVGGTSAGAAANGDDAASCGCRAVGRPSRHAAFALLLCAGLVSLRVRRRGRRTEPSERQRLQGAAVLLLLSACSACSAGGDPATPATGPDAGRGGTPGSGGTVSSGTGGAVPTAGTSIVVGGTSAVEADCDNLLEVTYRDFDESHPDFEMPFAGDVVRIQLLEPSLGPDRKPVFASSTGCPPSAADPLVCDNWTTSMPVIESALTFDQWYRTTAGVNQEIPGVLELLPNGGQYVFDSNQFFPLGPNEGFGITPANNDQQKNFLFTSEIHMQFAYQAGQIFRFRGDDDLWIYVNDSLAMDLGSMHTASEGVIDFDAQAVRLGISPGGTYAMDIFHAERHTRDSNFRFETNIACFVPVEVR